MTGTGSPAGAAISIEGVSKFYSEFIALKDINLIVKPGEFMSFLGPSGSGKTTMLNLIAGFTTLGSGDIRLGDRSIGNVPAHKRNIGVVFQHYALFPHMTVEANVAYPLRQRGVPKAERELKVREALTKVKLEAFSGRYPSALSGGQQQRVALARAMVFSPPLLLMDEPLGALDKKLREVLQSEIRRIHRELGSTFVYVTHDQEEALALSDRIAVFNKGGIEQVGTSEELYMHPKTLFVGQFIGESSVLRGPHRVSDNTTALKICGTEIIVNMLPQSTEAHVVLLRPDAVSVNKQHTGIVDGRSNVLSGRLCDKLYLGSSVKYEVALDDGSVVTARMAKQQTTFDIGETVEIAWSADAGILLPDDGTPTTIL